jgi:hypothetical protein
VSTVAFLILSSNKRRLRIGIVTLIYIKWTNDQWYTRLARLERTVDELVGRLDAKFDGPNNTDSIPDTRPTTTISTADGNPAPVFLLRDAATDAGVHSPETSQTHFHSDVISSGLVSISTAHSLLDL